MAETSVKIKQARKPMILYESLHPLQHLRPSAFCSEEVRNLQDLLP